MLKNAALIATVEIDFSQKTTVISKYLQRHHSIDVVCIYVTVGLLTNQILSQTFRGRYYQEFIMNMFIINS